jgi:xanthine/CO dehydrogenase XdhC/CoxF family maturation factor
LRSGRRAGLMILTDARGKAKAKAKAKAAVKAVDWVGIVGSSPRKW